MAISEPFRGSKSAMNQPQRMFRFVVTSPVEAPSGLRDGQVCAAYLAPFQRPRRGLWWCQSGRDSMPLGSTCRMFRHRASLVDLRTLKVTHGKSPSPEVMAKIPCICRGRVPSQDLRCHVESRRASALDGFGPPTRRGTTAWMLQGPARDTGHGW